MERHLISRSYNLEPLKVKPKMVPHLSLLVDAETSDIASQLPVKAARQAVLLRYLSQFSRSLPRATVQAQTGCPPATVRSLVKKKLVAIQPVRVERDPLVSYSLPPSFPLVLNSHQAKALQAIKASLAGPNRGPDSAAIFLLHGVTASGKTEVYLQALSEAVKLGKRGIVLVPEIALTPQTIERFAARFPSRVAVLHSQLTLGERFDEWQRIRKRGI